MGRTGLRITTVVVIMAMLAAACGGGGSDDAVTDAADAQPTSIAVATTPPISFPDDDAGDAGTVADPIPTVDPCTFDPENCSADNAELELDIPDPNETVVLVVKEANQLEIPTFASPNGEELDLYDVNEIDGIRTPYPLNSTTYYGNPLALMVKSFDSTGNWAEVYLPIRPNGSTGFVQVAFFDEVRHDYHITVDLSENNVTLFKGDEVLIESNSVIGRPERPTPVLRSYIDEKISGAGIGPAYGSWVLSIAAFSESLGTFGGGGMPKLALHGTNQPDLMGDDVSSGCVRVPNDIIEFIAETVPVGTPVDIIA